MTSAGSLETGNTAVCEVLAEQVRGLTAEVRMLRQELAAFGSLASEIARLRDAVREEAEQRASEMLAVSAIYDAGAAGACDRSHAKKAPRRERPQYLHLAGPGEERQAP
jgi:hypothetical protein